MKGAFTIALMLAVSGALTRAAAQTPEPPDGQALYLKNCRQCHGTMGTPPKTMKAKFERIPDLADAPIMTKLSDDSLLVVIRMGVNKEQDMKGFGDRLSPEEMKALAKYVRSLSVKSP